MARQNYIFTSESVSEGHPDKVCDRISDEIVDLVYREAKKSGMNAWDVRVACETLATTNRVVIAGEVRVPPSLLKKDKDGGILHDAKDFPVINPAKFKSVARKAINRRYRFDELMHRRLQAQTAIACVHQEPEGSPQRGGNHHVRVDDHCSSGTP